MLTLLCLAQEKVVSTTLSFCHLRSFFLSTCVVGGRIHFNPKPFHPNDLFIQARIHPITVSSKHRNIQAHIRPTCRHGGSGPRPRKSGVPKGGGPKGEFFFFCWLPPSVRYCVSRSPSINQGLDGFFTSQTIERSGVDEKGNGRKCELGSSR